jgi:phosphoglycolate phosphatase-like HAD superfamily hydrolase
MPGARELLEALDDHHHLHLALLTGNYREAAEVKLQHFELWDFFEWGAFSDDAADRNALVPIARRRAETYDIPGEAIERVIVIGDTPHDIHCANAIGARTIAVATGGYSAEELAAHHPWRVFDELPVVGEFMRLIESTSSGRTPTPETGTLSA